MGCFIVALTGGIASGKSATAQRFARAQVPVFDADGVAREVVARGQPALGEIRAAFGSGVVTGAGELDRAEMRKRVFSDDAARKQLEAILHPRIRSILRTRVQNCSAAYCILAVPLLVEHIAQYHWVNRILVTDVPKDVQLQRVSQRAGIDEELARRMIDAQAGRAQRLAVAHDVIDNTGPLAALDAIVARLHRLYLVLASGPANARSAAAR